MRWVFEWEDGSGDADRDVKVTADTIEEYRDCLRRLLTGHGDPTAAVHRGRRTQAAREEVNAIRVEATSTQGSMMMYFNRRADRIRRAWNEKRYGAGIGALKADSPPVVEINNQPCREVTRTAKAIKLQANGVEAWFPLRTLLHLTQGIVSVVPTFHADMDADQRKLVGMRADWPA